MDKIKAQALIVDGDGTLWEGRVAAGIGKSYLMKELFRGHFHTFSKGLNGAKEVKQVVVAAGINGEVEGLKKFYEVLVSLGIGKNNEMYNYALKYIRKHEVKEVHEFLKQVRNGTPTIISTIGGSTAARAAVNHFGIDYILSNEDQFCRLDGKLSGVKLIIRSGEEKLSVTLALLDKLGIKPTDCAAVGDSKIDIPILKSVKLRYASPLASEEVKKVQGVIQIHGYI